ncbi:Uncharacterised protein [Serratia fonticola]|uniref:HTH tetR-type domain-containing protein n=1 Tax=Serratia fonticola TaxID=47917 RepID=A0A4V6KQW6_SERFO|nr:Uncharacterised protein [Serratia fonticola]
MGRQRSIDRDKVLDTAEEIVATQGAAGLTIDSVPKPWGSPRGGVQYCFGSKDALIDAMFDRWGKVYEQVFDDIAGSDPDPLTIVQGAYAGYPQFGSGFQRQGSRVDGDVNSDARTPGQYARMVSQAA